MPNRARRALIGTAVAIALAGGAVAGRHLSTGAHPSPPPPPVGTATPISHLVVIFDENVSFDHYFGTYPVAANTDGTRFVPRRPTPRADNLAGNDLLAHNPNLLPPVRLSHEQAMTCDQDHGYAAEQRAVDGGANDRYVQSVSVDACAAPLFGAPGLTMDYYDGNTVTAMWNYAQHYAMSDNSYGTVYGPSSPGALNLVSGRTHGIQPVEPVTGAPRTDTTVAASPDATGMGTMIGDPDPFFDDCADRNHTTTDNLASASGQNIGDLLNRRGVTWGWFQGGFRPTTPYAGPGSFAVCGATHPNLAGADVVDYSPHHAPFQYYRSTSNPHHLPPSSVPAIGRTDRANHNYDLSDFDAAIAAGNLPAVSFLKAAAYQDGHAGYSDPLDEQHFLVDEINTIQRSRFWPDTAIVVAYDDSDGWYDHRAPPVRNGSTDPGQDSAMCRAGPPAAGGHQDRCGLGPRLPLLVISPFARANHIDHTRTEQTSILRFIEDNWRTGRIGDGSFDQRAGTLADLLTGHPDNERVLLNRDGSVASVTPTCRHPRCR